MSFTISSIGHVAGGRIPDDDDGWDAIAAKIELDTTRFGADALLGLDAIDGTPVIDIKPVMAGFAPRGAVREPEWAREIMADYW